MRTAANVAEDTYSPATLAPEEGGDPLQWGGLPESMYPPQKKRKQGLFALKNHISGTQYGNGTGGICAGSGLPLIRTSLRFYTGLCPEPRHYGQLSRKLALPALR